jgi:hypothetical protein
MPSDPPAAPCRDRAGPVRPGRAAPGGSLARTTFLPCLTLLFPSGLLLRPGGPALALAP